MWGALLAGLATGSSLVVGGAVALVRAPREHTLGLVMAFGAGVLLSAVAYDLVAEALDVSGGPGIVLGLAAGALTFFYGDRLVDRAGGGRRKAVKRSGDGDSPRAIVLGTILDGVPESIVVGLTLLAGEGVSIALFAAVFLSNVPESIAATSGLAASGMSGGRVLLLWTAIAVLSGLSALAGYALLGSAAEPTVAFVLAFAAGAVLTMLADTMMPEAFAHGGNAAGLATTFGFVVAFGIAALEGAA
jgi:ZIP family zinc transporter